MLTDRLCPGYPNTCDVDTMQRDLAKARAENVRLGEEIKTAWAKVDEIAKECAAISPAAALRILRNYLGMMSKRYREKNPNWQIVRDILLGGQHAGGCLDAMEECERIGVDPEGYDLEGDIAEEGDTHG